MEATPVSLAAVVRRACEIIDPDDTDPVVGDFEQRFEDADEPITAVGDLERRLADVLTQLDPGVTSGSLSVATAVTQYLARRRDELDADDATILRLSARAEWPDHAPEAVRDWLTARGVDL